ncbi:MAG TPA: efflux RND transporter periplasmic adaptor subunit [Flavobacteriia bacterium]|nr:efflux RND transporter periplasmic adaptor subunit [Flavobacteriia bacterium]
MKKIIILLITISLFSCSTKKEDKVLPNSLEGLNKEKQKLEKAKDSIDNVLATIETKLESLDTVKKLQPVTVLTIKPTVFKHFIAIQGNTETDKNIIVRPLATGQITKVYVKEGQRVGKGQTLMQIDDAILRNSINEIENQLSLANTTYERQKRLWEQKIGSEMQYLQAKTQKEALEKKIKTLQSQLKNYKIKAPFNGIVDDVMAKLGDLASPQAPAVRLINLNSMYVESDVSENYLKNIKKGNETIVELPTIGEKITTKISKVGNFINPDNRSFKVRVNIKNKKNLVKPNMLADIKIKDYENNKAITIPTNLVQIDENGKTFVFVLVKEKDQNIVVKKPVEIGKDYNGITEIINGLTTEDIIINEGARNVSEGQKVKVD